jgi:hypothetical protein
MSILFLPTPTGGLQQDYRTCPSAGRNLVCLLSTTNKRGHTHEQANVGTAAGFNRAPSSVPGQAVFLPGNQY